MIPRRYLDIKLKDWVFLFKEIVNLNKGKNNIFSMKIKSILKINNVFLVASGRDAIMISLKALGLKKGDEILIPAYTLGELIPLLEKEGFILRAVDIEDDSFTIDTDDLAKKLNPKIKCIMVTHLLGAPCNMDKIMSLAKSYQIPVLEDCAHSFGAKTEAGYTGSLGDIGIFSFESNKPLPTYGGGAIVTKRDDLAYKVDSLISSRDYARLPVMKKFIFTWLEELLVRSPLYSFLTKILFSPKVAPLFEKFYRGSHKKVRKKSIQFSNFQAEVGIDRLDNFTYKQDILNSLYEKVASNLPENILLQKRAKYGSPVFYNMVVLFQQDLVTMRSRFNSEGIDIGIGSEVMDDCSLMLNSKDCPVCSRIFNQAVILPVHKGLTLPRMNKLLSTISHYKK
jgi:perosamine synthetase